MATIGNLVVDLILNSSGFSSGIREAAESTKDFQKNLERVNKIGSEFSKIGKSITKNVTVPVVGATTALIALGSSAESARMVERSFYDLAASAGVMGSSLLTAMQNSSRGLISNIDLMKNFNLAANLIGTDVAVKLPEAFEYLGKVSAATGLNMEYLLNSLILGVGRLTPRIIDNLGVQLSLNEAYEEWAAVNGRSVDSMTQSEKQMALMELTMKKLAENTASLSNEFGTTGERIKTAMENAGIAIGSNLVPALQDAGLALIPVIERFAELFAEGGALHPVITTVGDTLQTLVGKASEAVTWLGSLSSETVESATKLALFVAAAGPVLAIFGSLISTGAKVVSTLTSIGTAFGLAGGAATLGGGAFALALTGVGLAIYGVIQAEKDLEVRQENQRSLWTELSKAVDDGRLSLEDYNIILADLHRGFITNAEALALIPPKVDDATDSFSAFNKAFEDSKTYAEFQDSLVGMGLAMDFVTEAEWRAEKGLEGVAESAGETAEVIKELTYEQKALNSQIAFVHDNLKTYNDLMGELTAAKEAYEALPQWKKDQEEGLALLGIMGDINNKFETMVAQANAQSLFEAIMRNGEATRAEFQMYLDYLEQTGLATKETTEKMMEHWELTNNFQQSLSWDAEGNVTITVDDGSALQTIADIKAQLSSIERNIGVTVTVTQIGRYLTGDVWQGERALGGPVEANNTYLVGERGAELFIPDTDGRIIPHHDIDKYMRKENPSTVNSSFDIFEEDSSERTQNNYNLTLNMQANENSVITAFRMMEALNS